MQGRGPAEKGDLFASAFWVTGITGDGEGAIGSEELERLGHTCKSGLRLRGDRFIAAGEIA